MSDEDYEEEEYVYDIDNCEEYECRNVGCVGTGTFLHNEASWFKAVGAFVPSNCKPCNNWKDREKVIGSISATCRYCAYTWEITFSYRIMHHRNDGNWDDYWEENEAFQICRRCTEEPGRKRLLAYLKAKKQYADRPEEVDQRRLRVEAYQDSVEGHQDSKEDLLSFMEYLGISGSPSSYHVPNSMVFYAGVKTPKKKIPKHGKTQLTHILKETHEWREKFGTEDPHSILTIAAHIAVSTEDQVAEFTDQKTGLIVKYDTEQEIFVLIRESQDSPTGYLVHTAYVMEPDAVQSKLENKKWL